MDFNKVAKKIVGYVNESVASGKGSVNVIYNSLTLGKTISLVAESKQDKAFVEFKPTRSPADYSLKISLTEETSPESIIEAIVKGMKDHVVKEAWYDDDEELDALEKKKEKEEFGDDLEDDVDPEDVDLYADDFGAKSPVEESADESAEEENDDEDEDEEEDKYSDLLKNKGRISKVANRPAKTPMPTLGEAAIKTDLSANKASLSKDGLKGCACKTLADPSVPADGNATTKQVKDVEKSKSKNGKSPIKDKTPAPKVPKDGNLQDMKKAKTAMGNATIKEAESKTGHDLLTSIANNFMYDQTMNEYWDEEAGSVESRVLVDGVAGIYVPQRFVTNYDATEWGIKPEDAEVLAAGPDAENYWEVWDDVLANAHYTDKDGKIWSLEQDSDLFAVNVDSVVGDVGEDDSEEEHDDTRHYI